MLTEGFILNSQLQSLTNRSAKWSSGLQMSSDQKLTSAIIFKPISKNVDPASEMRY